MIESREEPGASVSAAGLAGWVDKLAGVDTCAADADLIDQITQLERLKSACAAAQATLTVAFVDSQTTALTAAQSKDERIRRSINAQVALARRESPVRGGRHVGLATALIREMPNAYTALRAGEISEWRATLLVRETACLSADDRQTVDRELAGRLASMGDRETEQAAMRIAQRLDPEHCVARNRKAVGDRRVSIRPAPDTMTYLTALLPVAHGVGVYAALTRYADTARAVGDPRSRGQLMADELVTRITSPSASVPAGAYSPTVTAEHQPAPIRQPLVGQPPVGTMPDGQSPSDRAAHPVQPDATPDLDPTDEKTDRGHDVAAFDDNGDDDDEVDLCDNHTTESHVIRDTGATDLCEYRTTDSYVIRDTGAADHSADTHNIGVIDCRAADDKGDGNHHSEDAATDTNTAALGCVPTGLNLDIHLVMTDRTLFDGDAEPAILTGYGPIPAPLARQLVREAGPRIKAWIRRLFTDPGTGHLTDGDIHRRTFPEPARQFLIARDQTCRTPWCDAPIRHADHVAPHQDGGPTHISNGQGLCERCNYTKQEPGWASRVTPDGAGIMITTPTGHTTRSDPPPPPRSPSWDLDAAIERTQTRHQDAS